MSGYAAALLALGAAVLAPGYAVARGLRLSRDPLVTLAVSVAAGRLLFAAATLVAVSCPGRPLLVAFALAGCAAAAWIARARRERDPRPGAERRLPMLLACLVAAGAGLLLVHAIVARSGLPGAGGDLVFYGRDSTNDPLVYGSMAIQLATRGLPLVLPFGGGLPGPAPYGSYAMLAGVQLLSGASILDVAFRVLPGFDAVTMTLSGVALARALGGGALAAGAGGALLALGSEASFAIAPAAALFGRTAPPLDSWALFGPYLAAFNPIAGAVQTFLAAASLLAGLQAGRRAGAVVAGLLVASLFELKLFLWAPALVGLAGVAWLRPPRVVAAPLRLAAWVALLGSLPSVLDRLRLARTLAGRDETAFHLCVGCLPRYLAEAAWGSHDLSFARFRSFRALDLLEPQALAATLFALLVVGAIVLGARGFALPVLWRGARADDARAAVLRWIGLASLAGLGAASILTISPHYLNGAQFAWVACFGLWPLVGLELEHYVRARRFELALFVLGLSLCSSAYVFERLGYGAPVWQRVSPGERELLSQLPALSQPQDVVLEPSMLADTDRASPVPWIAGRCVYLSLLSAVLSLPEDERNRRFDELLAIFGESDAAAAQQAVTRSGARWVYAPAAWRLRFDTDGWLEPVLRSPAGTIYRVRPEEVRTP